MVTFAERPGWGKAPDPVAVCGRGAHEHAVVVQADDGVSLRRSAERWQRIIGCFTGGDGPRDRTDVIKYAGNNWYRRYAGKRCQNVTRRADVACGILGADLQRLPTDLRWVQREGEITGGVGGCRAEHRSTAGGNNDRAVWLGNAGERGTVGVYRQPCRNARGDGIDHDRCRRRYATGITRTVRCGDGKGVGTLCQRGGWGVTPVTAAVRRHADDKAAVIVNIDPRVGFCGAV